MKEVPAEVVVGVAGNHDWAFFHGLAQRLDLPWTYLSDSSTEVEGLVVYGSPWQPPFFDWAFNLPEEELVNKWALIPNEVDILLLHGSPRGYGDRTRSGEEVGSPSLTQRVREVRPHLTVAGHVHPGRGVWTLDVGGRPKLSVPSEAVIEVPPESPMVANASLVDSRYRRVYSPLVFEL